MLLSIKQLFTLYRRNAIYKCLYSLLQKKVRTSKVSRDPPPLCLTSPFCPLWIIADRRGCGLFDRQSKKHQQGFVATGQQCCSNLSSCQALISDGGRGANSSHLFSYELWFLISILICIYMYICVFSYLFITWLEKSNWNLQKLGCHLIEFPHFASGEFVFGAH